MHAFDSQGAHLVLEAHTDRVPRASRLRVTVEGDYLDGHRSLARVEVNHADTGEGERLDGSPRLSDGAHAGTLNSALGRQLASCCTCSVDRAGRASPAQRRGWPTDGGRGRSRRGCRRCPQVVCG
jgi:hypothetical protein